MVLNIAEGNGRYAELDHHRFLQIAQSAAVKGAVFLDLGVERALLGETEATAGKECTQDQRHGGGILNLERQSGRQSEDNVRGDSIHPHEETQRHVSSVR